MKVKEIGPRGTYTWWPLESANENESKTVNYLHIKGFETCMRNLSLARKISKEIQHRSQTNNVRKLGSHTAGS